MFTGVYAIEESVGWVWHQKMDGNPAASIMLLLLLLLNLNVMTTLCDSTKPEIGDRKGVSTFWNLEEIKPASKGLNVTHYELKSHQQKCAYMKIMSRIYIPLITLLGSRVIWSVTCHKLSLLIIV